MLDRIRHRGPDGDGVWQDGDTLLVLGHRRLSILDLSPQGAQPMASASGRYVISFNGEIYNHLELRSRLQAQSLAPIWRGHSDTETLLAAIEAWGLVPTLQVCVGMFALAVWDCRSKTLSLARDRIGEKPLYYGDIGGAFVFCSDLRGLEVFPGFDGEIDRRSVASLLQYLYIPDPFSIYAGVSKLKPGFLLQIENGRANEPVAWWSMAKDLKAEERSPARSSVELEDELERLLSDAVSSQMISDVPLGSFLSGGVDSSLVTALMQKRSSRRVRTFSIGFEDIGFNEAPHAAAVARHLGTDHAEFVVTQQEALRVVPELTATYDEPFADSSQIPTLLLSRVARPHITVALTGDGGDEIFGGYNRYTSFPRPWRLAGERSQLARDCIANAARLSSALFAAGRQRVEWAPMTRIGAAVQRASRTLDLLRHSGSSGKLYQGLVSLPGSARHLLAFEDAPHDLLTLPDELMDRLGAQRWMMGIDTLSYLPGDILVKVDRAAMSASLETRAPMLDAHVLAFAARLPIEQLMHGGVGKQIVRRVLYKHVPPELIERPKQGFSVPLGDWLRQGLREWAEALLSTKALQNSGLFKPLEVERLWRSHLARHGDHSHRLWAILMMQSWLASRQVSAQTV